VRVVRAWQQRWQRITAVAREFFERHWRALLVWRHRLRPSEETVHLLLAAAVGVLAASVNRGFRLVTDLVSALLLHREGELSSIAELLPLWARLTVPVAGGLAAGAILQYGLRMAGPQGSTNLLEVVVAGDGRLPFRSTLVKALSSLVSIATGAPIGREGSITQLSATLASKAGQLAAAPPYRLRLLLACGAAAGMASAYNAPIAGAVFAAQIVLGNFSMNLFAPLIVASVVAAVLSRSFFGLDPWYTAPVFEFTKLRQLPWFLVLGLAAGVVGAAFLAGLRRLEALFQAAKLPPPARLMLAGLVVGLLALAFPQVWGNGYLPTARIMAESDTYGFGLLALLLAARFTATVVTVGAGTVGGVFTPTLFLGAVLGSLFGLVLHAAGWGRELPTAAFALVGMGSMLAATTHSPLLAMITVFEISLNYSLMPALMVACALGTLVGRRLHPGSVYTEPLRQKSLLPEAENEKLGAAIQRTVGDLMHPPVPPLRQDASFREISDRFLTTTNNNLPVVDATGRLLGLVALQDMKEYLNAGLEFHGVIAYDILRPSPPVLKPGQPLQEALPVILASELRNIPVVSDFREMRLIGALSRSEALGLLSEAIPPGRPDSGPPR
jgi:CIC family chloride channel protein